MENSPFFTVITPVYNRETIVAETIESVLNQGFKNFEYLLIDDCSTDHSVAVLEEYAKEDPRIKVIKLSENKGRCLARNTGLENAKGSWICYLDSDDIYFSNHLEVFYDLIQNHPNYNAFAVDQNINNAQKVYRDTRINQDEFSLSLENFIEDNPLTANQVCHARKLNTKWSDERIPISEDWLFFRMLSLETPILKKAIVTNNLTDHADRSMNQVDAEDFVKNNLFAANKFIRESNSSNAIKLRVEIYTKLLCANVYLNDKKKQQAWNLLKPCISRIKAYKYSLLYKAVFKFLFR